MARDAAKDLIHYMKWNPRDNLTERTEDLTQAYEEIELMFSDTDKMYCRQLYEWALIGYSGYNPQIGQLLSRPDADLLKNQVVEAIVLLETRIDRLALLMALDMADDSSMMQDAKYWLKEAIEYMKIIAEKIMFIRGLEENVMKAKNGYSDELPEKAALEYLDCLETNQKQFQDHMDKYFAEFADNNPLVGDNFLADEESEPR